MLNTRSVCWIQTLWLLFRSTKLGEKLGRAEAKVPRHLSKTHWIPLSSFENPFYPMKIQSGCISPSPLQRFSPPHCCMRPSRTFPDIPASEALPGISIFRQCCSDGKCLSLSLHRAGELQPSRSARPCHQTAHKHPGIIPWQHIPGKSRRKREWGPTCLPGLGAGAPTLMI